MRYLKLGAATLNQTALDWTQNKNNILEAIEEAKKKGIQVLCLPELCITGYGCEDQFYSLDTFNISKKILSEIVTHSTDILVTVGMPIWIKNKIYNATAVLAKGQILGFVCKQHLPNYGLFYEDRWFHRWKAGQTTEISIENIQYPVGDLVFKIDDINIGVEICEDAWVPNRPGIRHFERGVDILLNPSASPFSFGKYSTREQIVKEASRAYNCAYVYTNLVGNETGRLIFDGDAMICSGGELLASSDRFTYSNVHIVEAVVNIDINRIYQSKIKTNIQIDNKIVPSSFEPVYEVFLPKQKARIEAFEKGGYIKEEEFSRAVSLGLFDYLRKSHSNGFTVSLSGGADSCACVALCGLMLRLAEESIGLDQLRKKLDYIPGVTASKNIEDLSKILIHSIYQGTSNSSDQTLHSASQLAKSIGAQFSEINIDGLVNSYVGLVESTIDRKLAWETDDIALQNIQARVRAPGVWLLANINRHLLLATSNRSEVAVGYCTMDGDTAGSISPLAGIDKFWLRTWLLWLETRGCEVNGKQITIAGLQFVNALQPTAELRPKGSMQTDEKDLMPYEVLNQIELLAIKDKASPIEVYKSLMASTEHGKPDLLAWTKRFFTLWSRTQWKRERYAPGFHLDTHNLDPRSWCRFPILSGSFQYELEELQNYYDGKQEKTTKKIGF